MIEAAFEDIDNDLIEKIKADTDVIACVGASLDKDMIASVGEAVTGQSFVDKDGIEHENWCNSHPRKRARLACDCGAK